MNSAPRVIGFVNAAHFIDHYAMLIFAAAVVVMGPALGMAYSELLPYATPGFVAFGAGSLITEGKEIPDRSVVMGAPGRIVRELTAEQSAGLSSGAMHYVENWKRFRAGLAAL